MIYIIVTGIIICLAVVCFVVGIMYERSGWYAMLKKQQEGIAERVELVKNKRWITTRIPDGTYGGITFKNCNQVRRMPDDYFDQDGVW